MARSGSAIDIDVEVVSRLRPFGERASRTRKSLHSSFNLTSEPLELGQIGAEPPLRQPVCECR